MTLKNDGTGSLTGISTLVTPLSVGVVMIDDTADYADLAAGDTTGSIAPHYTAQLAGDLVCGQEIQFEATISSNEGTWMDSFAQILGEVIPGGPVVAWSEDFESNGIPSDWTIVDGSSDGHTWYADDAGDPAGCANTDPNEPIAGTWAAVDSDCTGSGVLMDEELISPLIDLTGIDAATLEFDHYFNWLGPETADVDIRSSLTSGAWVNVGRWTADTANPEHAEIDITDQAAGVADLQVRWHYYDADYEWFWYVDNVQITYQAAADCVMPVCPPGGDAPPPIPGGESGTLPMLADRVTADGSEIEISWDDQCLPVNTNLLYGPLGQVSTYTLTGSLCAISNPELWTGVPVGDLYFLLVSEDGAGVESSWGTGNGVERNGQEASGHCGATGKDITGTCP
jgi:hypothetical protein